MNVIKFVQIPFAALFYFRSQWQSTVRDTHAALNMTQIKETLRCMTEHCLITQWL